MDENNDFQSDENIETIMDVDSIEDHDTLLYNNYDNMSETSSQYEESQYSLDEDSLIIVEENDDNSSISDISNSGSIETKKQKIESTLIKMSDQKMFINDKNEDNVEIKICDQQVPIKQNMVSAVMMNPSKNKNLSVKQKNDSLNLETIVVPKTDVSRVKINSPVISRQIKKTPYILSTTSNARLQSKSNITGINCNKTYSKPKQDLKTSPSNDLKSDIYVVPQKCVNILVRKREPRSQSIKSNSMTSVVNAIDTVVNSDDQQNNVYVTSSNVIENDDTKINKFVARMQKLSDGKFKMIPTQGKVPVGLENVFKRNSHFVKQKIPTVNEHKIDNILPYEKLPVNTQQYTKEIRPFKKNQISIGKSSCNTISKTFDFGNMSSKKKVIPHTVTSKDALDNSKKNSRNSCIQEKCVSSGYIQMPPRSESLSYSDGQSLNVTRYNAKVAKNDNTGVKFLSIDSSFNKKAKVNTSSTNSHETVKIFPNEICSSKNIKINKPTVEHKNMLLSEEINLEDQCHYSDEDDENSGQFISCHYEYCETIVFEPELIDNLYCSLVCKSLDSKQISEKKSSNNRKKYTKPLDKKSIIDRKLLLAKLENRINKRKQRLSPPCRRKIPRNDDSNEIEQFENLRDESLIDHKQISQNSSHKLSSRGVEEDDNDDDDDDDDMFNPKLLKSSVFVTDPKALKYVEEMRFRSALKKLFDRPFPTEPNFFKRGQKLEGIDPEHEALFCVMTVVDVCGYRIKLHFDSYPNEYDFWVNADCPDLFFPKWCEQNNRTLQPPKRYGRTFNWDKYIKEVNAILAPKRNFAVTKYLNSSFVHKFCIGAKLEALDKLTRTLPKQLICVATVADTLYNRVRIHFDGWTDDFDYWTDVTSTNIHPVGWCESNGRSLSPPSGFNDCKGKRPFSWAEYLKETNSKPVPEDAFVRRPLRDFTIKMTIEVVDLVVPTLIRIAEIIDVRGDELKILYDGFHMTYAYWVEDDSPDIHPVGWALKTNHPIEIPPARHKLFNCKIMGCNGKGNAYNNSILEHTNVKDCPYEMDSWKIAVAGLGKLPDRLKSEEILPNVTTSTNLKSENIKHEEDERKGKTKLNTTTTTVTNNFVKSKGKITHNKSHEQLNKKQVEPERLNITNLRIKHNATSINNDELRNAIGNSLIPNSLRQCGLEKQDTTWIRHNAQLDIPLFSTTNARKWSIEEVAAYVEHITSITYSNPKNPNRISDRFVHQEIDGEAFLMLTQDELLNIMTIPLGHALKIHNAIKMLRKRVPIFDFIESMNCTKKK